MSRDAAPPLLVWVSRCLIRHGTLSVFYDVFSYEFLSYGDALGGDLPVGRIGFGTMCLTGPGAFGAPRDRRAMLATLHRAMALGVALVDTADSVRSACQRVADRGGALPVSG